MSHRKPNGNHKKHKSKKQRDKKCRQNMYETEADNVKKTGQKIYGENIIQDSLESKAGDINGKGNSNEISSNGSAQINQNQAASDNAPNINVNNFNAESNNSDTNVNNNESTNTDLNNLCEEIKAKQQELFDRLKNVSEALAALTLIRDNVNSIQVDTLTEVYFTRQVRPLLDALNIISFATTNMSATATAFQTSAFSDTKEIKNALKLSYKMNDEVDDIINSLGRRLAIFLKLVDNMDKNCPPFKK